MCSCVSPAIFRTAPPREDEPLASAPRLATVHAMPEAALAAACGVAEISGPPTIQWIGLRENLQETMVFIIKYRAFL